MLFGQIFKKYLLSCTAWQLFNSVLHYIYGSTLQTKENFVRNRRFIPGLSWPARHTSKSKQLMTTPKPLIGSINEQFPLESSEPITTTEAPPAVLSCRDEYIKELLETMHNVVLDPSEYDLQTSRPGITAVESG